MNYDRQGTKQTFFFGHTPIVLLSSPHELMNGNPSMWKNSRTLRCIGAPPVAANLQRPRPIPALAYGKQITLNTLIAFLHKVMECWVSPN